MWLLPEQIICILSIIIQDSISKMETREMLLVSSWEKFVEFMLVVAIKAMLLRRAIILNLLMKQNVWYSTHSIICL